MKIILKLTIVILAIFALTTQGMVIFISNTQASESINATKLGSRIELIQESNIDLQSKILGYASYDKISSRAAELGYESSPDFISVYDPLPIALK